MSSGKSLNRNIDFGCVQWILAYLHCKLHFSKHSSHAFIIGSIISKNEIGNNPVLKDFDLSKNVESAILKKNYIYNITETVLLQPHG